MVWLLVRLGIMPHARWTDLVWEIEQVMQEELDYRFEATNMRADAEDPPPPQGATCPKLFSAYSHAAGAGDGVRFRA